jgi:hypothetical protein
MIQDGNETISLPDDQSQHHPNIPNIRQDKYDPVEVQQNLGMSKIKVSDFKSAP